MDVNGLDDGLVEGQTLLERLAEGANDNGRVHVALDEGQGHIEDLAGCGDGCEKKKRKETKEAEGMSESLWLRCGVSAPRLSPGGVRAGREVSAHGGRTQSQHNAPRTMTEVVPSPTSSS